MGLDCFGPNRVPAPVSTRHVASSEDPTCLQQNDMRVTAAHEAFRQCEQRADDAFGTCVSARAADVAHLESLNKGTRRAVDLLRADEKLTLAAMRTCESLLSTQALWDSEIPPLM